MRLTPPTTGLSAVGNRLLRNGLTELVFGAGGTFDGTAVTYAVAGGGAQTIYAAWLNTPAASRPFTLDDATYGESARESAPTAAWPKAPRSSCRSGGSWMRSGICSSRTSG